jgi:probable rRNA maturation factor
LIRIEIANRQRALALDRRTLRRAVRAVLDDEGVAEAEISLAIVDDREIRELHKEYLGEDEPTDVLSFVFERSAGRLDGEVIASADTARREAARHGNSAADELLLYVIHGTLHLVGYRDDTRRERTIMSARQRSHMERVPGKSR